MSDAAKTFIETYQRTRASLSAADLGWLGTLRDEAMKSFVASGLPHRRMEDWRYTDLARLLEKATLTPAPRESALVGSPTWRDAMGVFEGIDCYRFVYVNGFPHIGNALSRIVDGVEFEGLETILHQDWAKDLVTGSSPFTQTRGDFALNTMLMNSGVGLRLKAGVKLDKPLHLIFLNLDDGASHLRHLIRLDDGAEATIYETYIDTGSDDFGMKMAGGKNYFTNHVSNISLGDNARLVQVKVQDEHPESIHLAERQVKLGASAFYSSFTMTLGAGLSRDQNFIRFDGEGSEAHVNGATALKGRQHGDQLCITDHAVPHCTSATLFRTVLDDASTGVFQGKVIVRPHAQKTDGRQMSNALLLSRDAAMNAKPELEIYADDVQCAHGSTIGELNNEALFYLRSRGIDEQTARQLLISAFLDEAFETVPDEPARQGLRELAADWFRLTEKEDA